MATPNQAVITPKQNPDKVSVELLAIWLKILRRAELPVREIPSFWFLRQGNFTLCCLENPTIGSAFYGMSKRNPELDPQELPFRGQCAAFGRAAKSYVDWLASRKGMLIGSQVPVQVHQQANQQPDAVTQARLRQIDLRTAGPADMYPTPNPEEFRP